MSPGFALGEGGAVKVQMANSSLYDDDIVLWSEEQAALIRRLGRTRHGLPNELDIENVAEEIESVGRSEMASVESFLRLLMLHLVKIAAVPDSPAASHWEDEARNFWAEAEARFAPSMAERLNIARAWRRAGEQALSQLARRGDAAPALSSRCPWTVEDLLREPMDLPALLARLREAAGQDAAG
jgi:hypothetical protein